MSYFFVALEKIGYTFEIKAVSVPPKNIIATINIIANLGFIKNDITVATISIIGALTSPLITN